MVQERSSHTSQKAKSTKRISPRFIESSKQATIEDELADLEEAIQRSSFALLPAVLTPSRAPSNTLIASTRALFFEGSIHLDFASGWAKGPVTEWYDRHRRKGSTLIEKLQLRKFLQPPYYHECIVVFTQGGHTYRVDRRPDPDAPFDTIMKAGCKPYDTVQAIESRTLKELEKASDCVVELHWHGKPTIDLLFVLSICFALRQDEHAKQYTLQKYNCYFLSWAIIMVAVRKMATWETRVDAVMSMLFFERKQIYHATRAALQELSEGDLRALGRHLKYRHHIELVLVQELVRELLLARKQVQVDPLLEPSLDRSLGLARALAEPAQVREHRKLVLKRDLELKRELVRVRVEEQTQKRELRQELVRDRAWMREQKLRRALSQTRVRKRVMEIEVELRQALVALDVEVEPKPAWTPNLDLDYVLGLAQELELRLVPLMVKQNADAMSKLLFPEALAVWLSTMLQNTQSSPLNKLLEGRELVVVHQWIRWVETLVRSTVVSKLIVVPDLLSICLAYKDTNPGKAKVSKMQKATHTELEQYMMTVLANHARRVARWHLAPAAEVEHDMREGMERVWLFVSQHPRHVSLKVQ